MEIKDIHTHLFPDNPGESLVCIGTDKSLVREGYCLSAGLHPWYVTGQDEQALGTLEELLSLPQTLAVGECGIDSLRGPSLPVQTEVFMKQIELSEKYQKPMILHVVRGFDTVIRLKKKIRPEQKWLIHGFRGGPEQMKQLEDNGLYVSFGLKHNTDALGMVHPDRLFLETDGKCPIGEVIAAAAIVRKADVADVERLVIANNRAFLSNFILERSPKSSTFADFI